MSLSDERERPCSSCEIAGTLCDEHGRHNARWKDPKKRRQLSTQLCDLYRAERAGASPSDQALSSGRNLLERLVKRDNLVILQIHLYEEGFVIRIPGRSGSARKVPYDRSFLSSLDDSIVPSKLSRILDEVGLSRLFYDGQLPVSIHNHLKEQVVVSYSLLESNNLLLASTTSSLGESLSARDQLKLESKLLANSVEPLCLDPNVDVAIVDNWRQFQRKIYVPDRLSSSPRPPPTKEADKPFISEFVARLAAKRRKIKTEPKVSVPQTDIDDKTPACDVSKFAKKIPRFDPTSDHRTMRLTQEDVLETVGSGANERTTKISIYQMPVNEQYFGTVVTQMGKHKSEHSFELGSYSNVNLYLNQFRELFTEEGRKAMKITHFVPGKAPIVRHTPGFNNLVQGSSQNSTPAPSVSTAPGTPASTVSPPPSTPLPSATPILAQHLGTPMPLPPMSPAPSLVAASPMPSTSTNSALGNFSINVVERVNFANNQSPTVVQIVKNIQSNVGGANNKPQVFLRSASGQPIVVPGVSMANMQGIQVHSIGNIKQLQGKVLQQVGVVSQKLSMNGPNASQFAVQLSQQMGKTIEVQQVANGPHKQLQLLAPHMNGNGQMMPHSSSMPHLSKVLTSTSTMSAQATQSLADQIAAQMRNKTGPRQVLIQPGQVANASQIHNIVQQISQQISAQKGGATAIAMGTLAPNITAVNSTPGQSGMVVGPTVLQMSGVKAPQQVVLQPQQMMGGVINGGRLVGVSPALLNQQGISNKPQSIVLQHGVQIADGTSNPGMQSALVQDNRTAMQILHAAVGTAHHATSMQLAAIQRQLQSQREKKS